MVDAVVAVAVAVDAVVVVAVLGDFVVAFAVSVAPIVAVAVAAVVVPAAVCIAACVVGFFVASNVGWESVLTDFVVVLVAAAFLNEEEEHCSYCSLFLVPISVAPFAYFLILLARLVFA